MDKCRFHRESRASIELDRGRRFAEPHAFRQAAKWQLAGQPAAQRVEAAAMDRRRTEARQGDQMRARRIAKVRRQAIAWVGLIQAPHQGIAVGLGDDRGGADAGHERIAADHSFNRAISKTIMKLRRKVPINNNFGGPLRQAKQCPLHRQQRGLQNIEQIDFAMIRLSDRNADGPFTDAQREHRAPLWRELLGIAQSANRSLRIQNHRSRDHWASERAASSFLHSRYEYAHCPNPPRSARAAIEAQLPLRALRHLAAMIHECSEIGAAGTRDAAHYRAIARSRAPWARAARLPARTPVRAARRPADSAMKNTAAAPAAARAAAAPWRHRPGRGPTSE